MAKNYGFTFSYRSRTTGKRVRRMSKVYRTKEEARKGVKSYQRFFGKGQNPRVVKATKDEYYDYVSAFQTGRI